METGGANDRLETLQRIAKQLNKRVKPIQLWDPNVCDFTIRDSIVHVPISGHPFLHELRFQNRQRRVILLANPTYICISVDSKHDFPILCSINQGNKIFFMEETHRYVGDDQRFPVFLETRDTASDILPGLLKSPVLLDTVEQLLRDRSESLHISNGKITLYSKAWAVDELDRAIEQLFLLMNTCEALGAPRASDFSDLPIQFYGLIPLIERWAESDDAARDALFDERSDSELLELVTALDTQFEEINEYLSSFEGMLPDSATALGTLAECAREAQLRLSQRNYDPGSLRH